MSMNASLAKHSVLKTIIYLSSYSFSLYVTKADSWRVLLYKAEKFMMHVWHSAISKVLILWNIWNANRWPLHSKPSLTGIYCISYLSNVPFLFKVIDVLIDYKKFSSWRFYFLMIPTYKSLNNIQLAGAQIVNNEL